MKVPAALHAELSDYASLVRVLRTSRTLDLTAHLLEHAARHGEHKSNAWTAWPLIDCPVPEWSLEDEIRQLGDTVVQASRDTDDAPDSDPDADLEGLTPAAANRLVAHTGAVLVHVLALLADQRPSVPGSMQNRLWQMNWEDVLSLLAVSGVVDPAIVTRAEQRLERIYGPSSTRALERLQYATSAKTTFSSLAAIDEDLLFASPVLPRSDDSGVKSLPIVDTDTDTDA